MLEQTKWYVGVMNDALFIIDQPPRPSNDHINFNCDANVIAKVADLGDEGDRHSKLLAASPDLLAACRSARRAFAELNGEVSREVWERLYEVTRVLDEAIGKAEG